nr:MULTISPECIES: hypothetical protein [Streptomyces]
MGPLTWVTSILRREGGFWSYLAERTRSRTTIELERERNAATINVLPLLRPGTDFLETEEGGRTRVIRVMPSQTRDSGGAGGEGALPDPSSGARLERSGPNDLPAGGHSW